MRNDDEPEKERSQLALTVITLRSWNLWSHEVLADRATKLAPPGQKVSAKTVGNVESDRHGVTVGKLRAIAAALGVEVWQLFLPPTRDLHLTRDLTVEISQRSVEDQRDILKLVRKLPVVEPPRSTDRAEVSVPSPVRRAGSSS